MTKKNKKILKLEEIHRPSNEEIIATMIKLYEENAYLEIDELIKLIKETKKDL